MTGIKLGSTSITAVAKGDVAIGKVYKGSTLVYESTPTPTPGFLPTDLTSLQAWYDASQLTGSTVPTWTDESGNGYDAVIGTGTEPTLTAAGLNDLNVVTFTDVTHDMTISSALMTGATEGGMIAVAQLVSDPPSSESYAGAILDAFTPNSSASHWPYSDGTIYDTWGTPDRKVPGDPTPSLTSPRIWSTSSAASDWQAYLDGVEFYATTSNTMNFGTATRRLGWNQASLRLHGFIAEIIVVDQALDETTRQKLEGYLAWKWGLVANLPAGHPYLSAAP